MAVRAGRARARARERRDVCVAFRLGVTAADGQREREWGLRLCVYDVI
jgi:hypothetical protein